MADSHPLKTYREQQDPPLTQEDLARLLGVTKATISRWESGSRKVDAEKLPEVSEKTGIAAPMLRPDLAELMKPEAAE